MKLILKRGVLITAYIYGATSCAMGVFVCSILSLIPRKILNKEKLTRWLISRLCAGLVSYCRLVGVLEIDFGRLPGLASKRGIIITANHPTYLDAVFMISQLPNVFCLAKADVISNPWVSMMVRSAGYECNKETSQLIENCTTRLKNGENLLIFPEGTRTTTPPIGKLKRGFAHMAINGMAPVVTVVVSTFNGTYLRKGHSFLSLPQSLPLKYQFTVSAEFQPDPIETSHSFLMKIQKHYQTQLAILSPNDRCPS